jgi:hypothetical protein
MTRSSSPVLRAWRAQALLATALLPLLSCASPVARVDVYDRSEQRVLETYHHRGQDYVVGREGNEYAIRIRNCTGRRVLAVVSVDGVNVITGETASPDQSGYVIEPYGHLNIEGWRKNLDRTAAFYFSSPADAYASRTGRPDDLGVIGVALFRERERLPPVHEADLAATPAAPARQESTATADRKQRAADVPLASAAPALGTGHGRGEWSPARQVEFERASARPDQRVVIRYDDRDNLVALGVLPRPAPRWHDPDPFPGSVGFVPDP